MSDPPVPRHLQLVTGTDTRPPKAPKHSLRLTDDQRSRLDAALRGLRLKYGTWDRVAAAMGMCASSLQKVRRHRAGSLGMAARAANLAGVSLEVLLSGGFRDAATCPTCGQKIRGA
jgi:hypothetical protein